MTFPLRSVGRLALASIAATLAACASGPPVDAEWTSPELGAKSSLLRGANVLVACEAPDVAVRNVCQDQLAQALATRGARPVFVSGDTRLVADRALDEQLLPGARGASTKAIVVLTLRPVATDSGGSGFSFGFGGFGIGRGSAVGVGASVPVGGTRVATGYSANGRVTDVSTGKLVWTASAASPPSEDLRAQFIELSNSVLDSATRAGLF